MPTETTWVNPETLRRLREESGLTIPSVGEQSQKLKRAHFVAVTAAQLQQWEAGQSAPELEHLETLSELYQCPVGYFFLATPPRERTPLSFRGLAPGKEQRFGATTRASLRRFVELSEWFVDDFERHADERQIGIGMQRYRLTSFKWMKRNITLQWRRQTARDGVQQWLDALVTIGAS